MEIDITSFFETAAPEMFSASVAELGKDAGRITWGNALNEANDSVLLNTPEKIEAWRDYVKGFGAWSDEEIQGWSDQECNALFIQYVSGDIREAESLCPDDDGNIDWSEYERLSSEGIVSGHIYKGTDGRIYFYCGD